MADIDCNSEMTNFHRDNVTLGLKQQQQMRVNRNAGRTRLENGLTEAGKPQPKEMHSQGSYQMRTMVQDDKNDYDIDDGAYFASADLKDDNGNALTPLAARERVCDAAPESMASSSQNPTPTAQTAAGAHVPAAPFMSQGGR